VADGQVDLGVPRVDQVVEVGRVDLGVALVPVEEGDLVLVEEEGPVDQGLLELQVMLEVLVVLVDQDHWKKQFLEFQGMIIQSLVMCQRPLSFVMARLMEATMPIQKLNVKHFIYVLMMEVVD